MNMALYELPPIEYAKAKAEAAAVDVPKHLKPFGDEIDLQQRVRHGELCKKFPAFLRLDTSLFSCVDIEKIAGTLLDEHSDRLAALIPQVILPDVSSVK